MAPSSHDGRLWQTLPDSARLLGHPELHLSSLVFWKGPGSSRDDLLSEKEFLTIYVVLRYLDHNPGF